MSHHPDQGEEEKESEDEDEELEEDIDEEMEDGDEEEIHVTWDVEEPCVSCDPSYQWHPT